MEQSNRRINELEALRGIHVRQLTHVAQNPQLLTRRGGKQLPGDFEFMGYLNDKFRLDISVEREIRIVRMVSDFIRGRVLDWGCHYGHACCLFRMWFGSSVQLYGCDLFDGEAYKAFHDYSGVSYRQLTHPYRLDYEDQFFDVVLSNGVLEHVPNELESLRELHRVLKPGGTFIITALPNRYSYTEAVARLRGMGHERLYTLSNLRKELCGQGFRVTSAKYFFALPTLLLGFPDKVRDAYDRSRGVVRACNRVLEALWPVNRVSSNLMVVAERT
jgi:SAM-dependent methyltransferase